MYRKWISLCLALVLLVSVLPVDIVSVGSEGAPRYAVVTNPSYAGILQEQKIEHIAPLEGCRLYGMDDYQTVEEAAVTVREAMKRREATVTVWFYTTESDRNTAAFLPFYAGVAHTGAPTEGDYLYRSFQKCGVSYYYGTATISGVAVNLYQATYTIQYMTTAEQEAELDAAVEGFLETIHPCADDYTKFMAVYDYICDNITYDFANLEDDSYTLKYTAYAAMMHKTAVCQGYAVLLYRLLLELGIDCRYVSGDGGGLHGWNIVELEGHYYNVDSTWDAGRQQYAWCLLSAADFVEHIRDAEFATAEFYADYPMAETSYVYTGDGFDHAFENGVCTRCGEQTEIAGLTGDISLDGDVDAEDLTLLARHVAGIEVQTDAVALANADVNGDGSIDANDLTIHARFVAGIISSWPTIEP